jgi:hypothetical protein
MALRSSYRTEFDQLQRREISRFATPNSLDNQKINIWVGDADIKLLNDARFSLNYSNSRFLKNSSVYRSVGRSPNMILKAGSSRYNNLWAAKNIIGGSIRPKPLTSESKNFPIIDGNRGKGKDSQVLRFTKTTMREKQFGFKSLSPFRKVISKDHSQLDKSMYKKHFEKKPTVSENWK